MARAARQNFSARCARSISFWGLHAPAASQPVSHWAESTNLVPFKSWRATMRAQRDTYACRHGTGVGSSSVRSLASRFFNGGSTWLATWPWQCEEALKSHVFWRGRSGARRGAPAPKEASRPAVSRSAARQEHEERTGGKRHHGESRNRVVGAAIKASALTVKRPTCGALGGH